MPTVKRSRFAKKSSPPKRLRFEVVPQRHWWATPAEARLGQRGRKQLGWLVRMVSLGVRPLTLPLSKAEAIKEARTVAKRFAPSTLVIKKRDGTIQEERTYGDDPYPPKG